MITFRLWTTRVAKSFLAAAIMLVVCVLTAYAFGFRYNWTASMPLGVYHMTDVQEPVKRWRIVAACAPPAAQSLALARGYLMSSLGPCEDGVEGLLKFIVAIPGDLVVVRSNGILVDGRVLPNSAPATVDSQGRPMPLLPRNRFRLGAGEFWLYAPKPNAFDSRYFGPVHRDELLEDATYVDGEWLSQRAREALTHFAAGRGSRS